MESEKTIQDALRSYFDNHRYVLTNSFVFSWESDFFSVTKTGTVYEVEVKISKADFKKDFEKEKHILFNAAIQQREIFITKVNTWQRGDFLMDVPDTRIFNRRWKYYPNMDESFTHEEDSFGYWTLRDSMIMLETKTVRHYADASHIKYRHLKDLKIPNRFYYACPENLIKVEEVPAYAGLLYVSGNRVKIAKKAPFLIKGDILSRVTGTLLDKFWYLSQRQRFSLVTSKNEEL